MNRTSIKNKLILSFVSLIFIVMAVVALVNLTADDFFLGQAISSAIALAFGIVFGNVFSNSLIRRLRSLSNVARKISSGDLSKEIPLLSEDEVRDLEEVFSMMVDDLRRMISDMRSASLEVQQTTVHLTDLGKKVMVNSEEIDKLAETIAKGSEDQTIIAQKTSLSMDSGLNAMQDMVTQSAFTVSKIKEAKLKTEKGESSARKTLDYLENVLGQMIEYSQPIYSLSHKVEKIRLVMNVIDEVAQRTDVLALNASIEATRAGELGKGFALVADEIRSMAENAKQSGQQIEGIVGEILKDNRDVIDTLRKSQEGVNKRREIIDDIVDTFGDMLSSVKDIFSEVTEIERVTGKQVAQMRSLLTHFQGFSRLANQNFVSTQKTTLATKSQKIDV
ncbi:MAG: methyl-accepting chemotaxis protein, partial [Deltaproteobacteria bacterium]|nr:methyl-accepting chemotaxis protein [Deltaproteobacteria bacterium]